jgi:hypothetical protein
VVGHVSFRAVALRVSALPIFGRVDGRVCHRHTMLENFLELPRILSYYFRLF